jgi:hypothetical protein
MTAIQAGACAPMSEATAARIRAQVWTPAMRKTYRDVPDAFHTCACQSGASQWCQEGKHARCHRGEPLPDYETLLCRRGGEYPATFPEPFTHPTPSATGARRSQLAMVWLADRVCRWVCPCTCHAEAPGEQLEHDETQPIRHAEQDDDVHPAEVQARAGEVDRAFRAERDRKDRIREWGERNGWKVGRRLSRALVEVYQVAEEDGEGQGALF